MATTLLLHAKHHGTETLYQPFGPWIVPWRFTSLEAEYHALRTGVGLIDYSAQALIQVQGADRVSFLHNLLTNGIKRLTPGSGCQAALLTANAKLIAPLLVLADPDALWLLCDVERADIVYQALARYLFSEQVTLTNHERRYAVLALQGPQTMMVLPRLFTLPPSLLRPGDHAVLSVDGVSIRLIRQTLTGDPGVLCVLSAKDAPALWEWIKERGRSLGIALIGWDALNTTRIEAGIPWWGIDMDESHLLPETGLAAVAVSDSKGCYVGQEIIARMSTYGSANKKLVGLALQGEQVPNAADVIVRDGETLGMVTSACFSPARHLPIALGYVKRGAYTPGTIVEIMYGTTRLAATVTTLPFVPHRS